MKQSRETLYWEQFHSPLGKVTVCCSHKGVRELLLSFSQKRPSYFRRSHRPKSPGVELLPADRHNSEQGARLACRAVAELNEYLAGSRKQFTVPLDLRGTPFQLKVWKALLRIPYGETRSYRQIAREVGNPRACRAVGMANRSNPVAILVPCHRVISADGTLGGYAGGLERKSQLLRMEKVASRGRVPVPSRASC